MLLLARGRPSWSYLGGGEDGITGMVKQMYIFAWTYMFLPFVERNASTWDSIRWLCRFIKVWVRSRLIHLCLGDGKRLAKGKEV